MPPYFKHDLPANLNVEMQKAVGHTNAPNPELEAELQQEYTKIVPMVERGAVTKAEADRLHSLEARAHGHTEKGGLTAMAQSVAARCERRPSVSSGGSNSRSRANSRTFTPHKQLHHDDDFDPPKIEAENWSVQGVAAATTALRLREQRSPEKSGVTPSSAPMKRLQSLSESTNTTRGGGSIYEVALPRLHTHCPADVTNVGSENLPHAHSRENSLPPV